MKKYRESGQAMTEFALILALVAVAAILVLAILGPALGHTFHNVADNAVNSDISNLGYRMTQTVYAITVSSTPTKTPVGWVGTLTNTPIPTNTSTNTPLPPTATNTNVPPSATPVIPTATPVTPTATPVPAWVQCANETWPVPPYVNACNIPGIHLMRYGAGSNWNYLTVNNSVYCDNDNFGPDPNPNTSKSCYYWNGTWSMSAISISPATGSTAGGTPVTISGTGLMNGATSITIGGNAATNISCTGTTCTATTPAHAAGAAVVTVSIGGQSATVTGGFTYATPASITSLSKAAGSYLGGTVLTITGTGFSTTGGTSFTFGGSAATSVTCSSSTTCTATTPAGTAGVADVKVTVNTISSTLTGAYTYLAPPTLTSLSKTSGPIAGGTVLTITGANFSTYGDTSFKFGGNTAASISCSSSTTCTASTPAHAAGLVSVDMTVDRQVVTISNAYTYLAAPTITLLSRATGSISGGTVISTITGTNFGIYGNTSFTFAGVAATSVSCSSATTCTATTPAHAAGTFNVVVTVDTQSGTLTNGFRYLAAPSITSLSTTSGTAAGGTTILTILGANFSVYNDTTITFGVTAAISASCSSDTTCTAITPAHVPGAVNVSVTSEGQTGTLTNGFAYLPDLQSLSPSSGTAAGGTTVTLSGVGMVPGSTSVKFGTSAATNVSCSADGTSCSVTTPSGSAGAVNVVVTVNSQSDTLVNGYTYVSLLTCNSVTVPGIAKNKGWYFTFATTLSGPIVATWTLSSGNSSTVYIYSGTPSFPTGNPTSLPSPNNPLSFNSSSGTNTLTYNNANVGTYTIFFYVTGSATSSKTPTITFYGQTCP